MTSDRKLDPILAFLVRLLLRPKVYYALPEQKGPDTEPRIYIANHTSHLDGPLITTVLRKAKIHNLAAKDRFEQPSFGFFLRHTGCIPIDRERADTSWIHESIRVLREEKESVCIFPEGRHGSHRKQLPFHPGAAMLAALSGAPLVMVYVDGPVKLCRRNKLIVSAPFRLDPPTTGIDTEYLIGQTQALQSRMKDLMDQFIRTECSL